MPATHPASAPVRSNAALHKPPRDPVRYQPSTFFLVTFYLVLLILCWAVTCALDVKPMTWRGSSWDGSQSVYKQSDLDGVSKWMRAIRFLNLFVAVIALPVVFAVISHAVVVLMERRKEKQTVSLHELLLLADPPWVGIKSRLGSSRWRVLLGLGLVFIVAIQPPLQAALVTFNEIRVAACSDIPWARYGKYPHNACGRSGSYEPRYRAVGVDPETGDLATMSFGYMRQLLQPQFQQLSLSDTVDYFASAIPSDTNTGVLKYHAMGLNSSVECTQSSFGEFPETCGGKNPLVLEYTTPNLEVRVCVPGTKNETAWALSRSMQTVSEDLWVNVNVPWDSNITVTGSVSGYNPTHCVVSTTRGYFELPNIYNNNTMSPTLAKWPDPETIQNKYNDRISGSISDEIPLDSDNYTSYDVPWEYRKSIEYADDRDLMPSPLLTTMRAALGNGSWFALAQDASGRSDEERVIAYQNICSLGLPFYLEISSGYELFDIYHCERYMVDSDFSNDPLDGTRLDQVVYDWFQYFPWGVSTGNGEETNPEGVLRLALYYTNYLTLKATADATANSRGRNIWTADGTSIIKPEVPLAVKIVISILIGVQVIALLALLGFIYHVPSFSTRLDAASLFILGAQLKDVVGSDMPKLGLVDSAALKKLEHVNAAVGLGDPNEIEMNTVPARRRDSDATLEVSDADSTAEPRRAAAQDAVSEVTIAVSRPAQSERLPPYIVSASGIGLIYRDPTKRKPGQRHESIVYA